MTAKTERATAQSWPWPIATSLGVGYLPKAPGTWGSAVGVALVAGVAAATRAESAPLPLIAEFTLMLGLAAIGLLAAERVVEANLPTRTRATW